MHTAESIQDLITAKALESGCTDIKDINAYAVGYLSFWVADLLNQRERDRAATIPAESVFDQI